MKKLIVTISLILIAFTASSQAILEHTYSSISFYGHTKLTNYGWVYSLIPYNNPLVLEIYSVNHTLIKSISMPVPSGYTFNGFYGISDNLFNSDNKIEVLYSYSKSSPSIESNLVLYNEDGSLLQFFSGQNWAYIFNIDGLFKLQTTSVYTDHTTSIYSLPGTMVNVFESTMIPDLFSLYPNPCQDHLSVELKSYPASMILTDMMGHIIIEQKLTSPTTRINTSDITPGQYIYKIRCSSDQESTGKIIVNR